MTITQDPTAPLVAVVGATGAQGGSVINALAESKKPYRIRGFTRDSTKPASQQLIAQGSVFEAFAGASMVFLVTNFWEHLDAAAYLLLNLRSQKHFRGSETTQSGWKPMMIDAAKAAGVDRIVCKLSGGKYTHSSISTYGRRSGVPSSTSSGYYASNLLRQDRRAFAIRVPVSPTTSLPVFDAERDYGLMTAAHVVLDMSDGYNSISEFGCESRIMAGKTSPSVEGLARTPISFSEFAKTADWTKVLV
ncbi:hypothetical protein B0H14DRAFT_2967708 [Mycena olivaceomarginata]|nr:hypothetical protein B0H14DRAFT_2967708 [Mycena olivaceomarginata]